MAISYFRQFPKAFKIQFWNLYDGPAVKAWSEQVFDTQAVVYYGVLKRWNGSTWVKANLKTFNGITFETKPLKVYDGSSFKLVDTSGV